jgi:hypothetical protein
MLSTRCCAPEDLRLRCVELQSIYSLRQANKISWNWSAAVTSREPWIFVSSTYRWRRSPEPSITVIHISSVHNEKQRARNRYLWQSEQDFHQRWHMRFEVNCWYHISILWVILCWFLQILLLNFSYEIVNIRELRETLTIFFGIFDNFFHSHKNLGHLFNVFLCFRVIKNGASSSIDSTYCRSSHCLLCDHCQR